MHQLDIEAVVNEGATLVDEEVIVVEHLVVFALF